MEHSQGADDRPPTTGSRARYGDRYFGLGRPVPTSERPEPPARPGARYGDRYLAKAPATGEVAIEQVATDGPPVPVDETGTAPRLARPWHAHPSARVALVGALVLGAIGGAYSWDQWQDRQVELAARASVDVRPRVTVLGSQVDTVTLAVRLENDGAYPVTVTGLQPVDPRLTLAPDEPDFEAIDIDPGASDTALVTFGYDCARDDPTAEGSTNQDAEGTDAVVVHLRAADGSEHDRSLPVDGFGVDFDTYLTNECGIREADQPTFVDLYPQVLEAAPLGPEAVSARVHFSSWAGPDVPEPNIVAVESTGTAFSASLDADSLGTDPGGAHITVTWRVADCAAALVADDGDMTLRVTGQMPIDDRTTTITPPPSTGLVVELVRLTERVCR